IHPRCSSRMPRHPRQQNQNPDPRNRIWRAGEGINTDESKKTEAGFWLGRKRCARLFSALAGIARACRSVELRALCNEAPRNPPGPEGSNGTGITSGAADHPEFLSLKTVYSGQLSVFSGRKCRIELGFLSLLSTEN